MMASSDRSRWNEKYSRGDHGGTQPSLLIQAVADWLPGSGTALDVAGGAGRHALWLAARGLDVTLADVSEVALQMAAERAHEAGLTLHIHQRDLLCDGLPDGTWDCLLIVHFLHRPLLHDAARFLRDGGRLVVLQPTRTNLQRHAKPPESYLLEDRELPGLVPGLELIYYREGWLEEGRHEALLIAEKKRPRGAGV